MNKDGQYSPKETARRRDAVLKDHGQPPAALAVSVCCGLSVFLQFDHRRISAILESLLDI
jgi:hypothetical protein